MHQEQRQLGSKAEAAHRTRSWGRTVRLWTPAIGTVITTVITIYQAWHGQPPG
ncbi:hypothetical protein OG741_37565 [Streptomyces sp. NBC_01410]|uniref:hypothetical protein n=1 Tax=Streptomyces sp. NBC_01410 TaxID=2903856 RepID=UPI0032503E56